MSDESIEFLFDRAARLMDESRYDDVIRCLDSFPLPLEFAEDQIEWSSMRAWALMELGRSSDALNVIRPLMEENPDSPIVLATYGVVLSSMNDIGGALQALERAYALEPDDEVTLSNLGLTYLRLREFDRAIEIFDHALELGYSEQWFLLQKCDALRESGKLEEAIRIVQSRLEVEAENADLWLELANLFADVQQFASATSCFRRASEIEPANADIFSSWGLSEVAANNPKLSRACLEKVRKIEGKSDRSILLEAAIAEAETHVRRAESLYESVLAKPLPATDPSLLDALEMAMDFFARRNNRRRCDELLGRAYRNNLCSYQLCETYRCIESRYVEEAFWFSLILEADYRAGLMEVSRGTADGDDKKRFTRRFEIIARDRDDAIGMTMQFMERMGEKNVQVRLIERESPVEDEYIGIVEVEPESVVFAPRRRTPPR
ncbi:MAG: tetratricopeptide repeat protein [Phycisphaerae bacterium]